MERDIEGFEDESSPDEIKEIIRGVEKGLGYPPGYLVSSINEMKERKGVVDRLKTALLTSSFSNQTFCFQQLCKIYLGEEQSALLEDERSNADSEATKAFKGIKPPSSVQEINTVIQKLTAAKELWEEIAEACRNEKANAPSLLQSKWATHLKRAEDKISDYVFKIELIETRQLMGILKREEEAK